MREPLGQNNRSHNDGPGKRAAPRFVNAGNRQKTSGAEQVLLFEVAPRRHRSNQVGN